MSVASKVSSKAAIAATRNLRIMNTKVKIIILLSVSLLAKRVALTTSGQATITLKVALEQITRL